MCDLGQMGKSILINKYWWSMNEYFEHVNIVVFNLCWIHYRNNLIDKKDSYPIPRPPSWDDRNYSYGHQLYQYKKRYICMIYTCLCNLKHLILLIILGFLVLIMKVIQMLGGCTCMWPQFLFYFKWIINDYMLFVAMFRHSKI
jgi:hypothetical protein